MKQLLNLFIFFTLVCLNLKAQNGNLIGHISDENGFPLPGANIVLNESEYYGISDFDGNFTILNITKGSFALKISYVGYETHESLISIIAGTTTKNDITLVPSATKLGEVIISSTLSRQAKALAQQKNNTNITNVVSADQMGKFPDDNIGESVRRISGITIQNDQGEARTIIIRGMSPQLNSVTLNGERIPSAEAESRGIQMDLIPADMIQTIQVSKTVTPDMDADAIGGSVNLVTRAAPSIERLSATLASGITTFNNKPIYKAALVYGNRSKNDKFGYVLSGSYKNVDYGSDNVEYERGEGNRGNNDPTDDTVLEDFQIRQYFVQRIRKSLSGNFDYKINNDNTLFLKGIYNHRNDFENRYRLRIKDLESDKFTIERQTKGGGSDNKNARLEDQRTWSAQLGGKHLLGALKMEWNVSASKASEDRPNERYIVYRNKGISSLSADFSSYLTNPRNGIISTRNGETVAYDDFKLKEITEEHQYTEEKDLNSKINFEIPLSQLTTLKFGARFRSKEKLRDNNFFEYKDANNLFEYMTTSGVSIKDYSNSEFLAGSQFQVGSFVTPSFLANLNLLSTDFDQVDVKSEYYTGNYNAKEYITAGYVMFESKLGSDLDLIIGARIENTKVDYLGFSYDEQTESTGSTSGSKSYTNFLPNIQLKYSISENSILRAAYTNTLARPNYYDIVPYEAFNSDDQEISLGNIDLEASTASNFDLMYETYFGNTGLISGGIFYKKIKDFIYDSTFDINDQTSVYDGYEATQSRNGSEANVIGFEVALQSNLAFLSESDFLKNLNIYANYTFTQTSTDGVAGREDSLPLPGTAGNILNASIGYDNSKFLLKLSANYTTDYIDEYGDFDLLDRYYDKQFFLDINTSYFINKKLNVFASATNLTNQGLRYYQGRENYTMQMEFYGLRFNLGLKYNL